MIKADSKLFSLLISVLFLSLFGYIHPITRQRRDSKTDIPNAEFYTVEPCVWHCDRFWIHMRYHGDGADFLYQNHNNTNSSSVWAYVNSKLSKSYRMLAVLDLEPYNFEFLYYGQTIQDRVVISSGGFLHIGDVVNRHHLTISQYVAPFMANFDFSLEHSSPTRRLLYFINETLLIVEWRNVSTQEYPDEPFTFQAQIYRNGTIVLAYYNIPIDIGRIRRTKHPVKAGISDAYLSEDPIVSSKKNKTEVGVNFQVDIVPYSIIDVVPVARLRSPTAFILRPNEDLYCLPGPSCGRCLTLDDTFNDEANRMKIKCTWCSHLKRCSSGYDRSRASWLKYGCARENVTVIHNCLFNAEDPIQLQYFEPLNSTNATSREESNEPVDDDSTLLEVEQTDLDDDDEDDDESLANALRMNTTLTLLTILVVLFLFN